MKTRIALFFFAICLSAQAFATEQDGEYIMWEGTMYQMLTCPLHYQRNLFDKFNKQFEPSWSSTALYRGYIGYWSIKDERLCLDSLHVWHKGEAEPLTVLPAQEKLFRKYVKNGVVTARWATGKLRVVSGDLIRHGSAGFERTYEHEDFLQVRRGKLLSVKRVEQQRILQLNNAAFKEMGAALSEKTPLKGGAVFSAQYSEFDADGIPTAVDVRMLKEGLEPSDEDLKNALTKHVGEYLLEKRCLPLYRINGKLVAERLNFRIELK